MPATRAQILYRLHELCLIVRRAFGEPAAIRGDHPDVVENYRLAHGIHQRAQAQQASTEDLREALLRYRSLFSELLEADDGQAGVTARRGPGNIIGQRDEAGSGLGRHLDGQDAAGPPDTISRRDRDAHERL
jgi:hypothetical protein